MYRIKWRLQLLSYSPHSVPLQVLSFAAFSVIKQCSVVTYMVEAFASRILNGSCTYRVY